MGAYLILMAITQERFDRLVSKLEEFSQSHPRSYRLRVALFAALGYSYIFMLLAVLSLNWVDNPNCIPLLTYQLSCQYFCI